MTRRLQPLVGSRIMFESFDEERYPEMALDLWDEPPQRRTGLVLSIDEVIYGMQHYVIVMDEPLNSNPGEIGEDLVEKYVAPTIDSPKRHIILVQSMMVHHGGGEVCRRKSSRYPSVDADGVSE
jgi:hypothetical protein